MLMLEWKTSVVSLLLVFYMCETIDSPAEGVQEKGAKEDIGPEQEKVIEVLGDRETVASIAPHIAPRSWTTFAQILKFLLMFHF
jgi:hypothetical protein